MKQAIIVYAMVFALLSCRTGSVSYDYDKHADFQKYKTYNFSDSINSLHISQLDKDRIIAAVDEEMRSRGYAKSDNPELLVDLHVKALKETTAKATIVGTGWGYPFGTGFTATSIDIDEYVEGTLFINIIDKVQNHIIWQGRATKTLDVNASPDQRESDINTAVVSIFKKYPVEPLS